MTLAQHRHGVLPAEPGKPVDVRARAEPAGLGGPDRQNIGPGLFGRVQQGVEFAQHCFGDDIGSRPGAVEPEGQRAVVIFLSPVLRFGRFRGVGRVIGGDFVKNVGHAASSSMAPPWPPPMHSVAIPRLTPRAFRALARCRTMRLPLVPTG